MLALNEPESVLLPQFAEKLQVALGGAPLSSGGVGENGVDVEDAALLHLPDPRKQPWPQTLPAAASVGLAVHEAPASRRRLVPGASRRCFDATAEQPGVAMLAERSTMILVPSEAVLDARSGYG